jgi:hypothetical protein
MVRQDPMLLSRALKIRHKDCGNRLARFVSDEGFNKQTGEIDWLRCGPFRCEKEDHSQPELITSIEYITGESAIKLSSVFSLRKNAILFGRSFKFGFLTQLC